MKITVYHKDFERSDKAYTRVAEVFAEGYTDEKKACEFAYRWTQNIADSWSHPQGVADKHENVVIVDELPVHNGRTMGLRSSMMGDRMYISGGSVYDVAMLGFEEVPTVEEVA